MNPFQENTWVVWDNSRECIIVDAGNSTPRESGMIEGMIALAGLKPVRLVNTHGHIDHIMGVKRLAQKYKIPFWIHELERPLLERSEDQAAAFGLVFDQCPAVDHYLTGEKQIEFGNSILGIIHLPGHSPGGIGLHSEQGRFVLTGDVLFNGGIGRTDLPGGDHEMLMYSIRSKLLKLDSGTTVLPGHGPPTTIGEEIRHNPFLVT